MKKLFVFASVIVMATIANASYLYWAVGSDPAGGTDILTSVTGYTKESEKAWTTANFYKGKVVDGKITKDGESLGSIFNWASDATKEGYAGPGYAILGDVSEGSSYSYYIELTASDGSTMGYSSGTQTYEHLSASLTDTMTESAPAVTIWHAGTYKATPEPTSAMLMLIGVAGLALRRKQRKA